MKVRILAVVLAIAALVGVVMGVARIREPHLVFERVRAFPHRYVGIVSYDVPAFDQDCDCVPNIAVHYIPIGSGINMHVPQTIIDTGAVPLLELEPYGMSFAKILSGAEDGWLTTYARAVKSLNAPVIMSFAPEANGTWYSWGYHHALASGFVRAWQHIVSIFRTVDPPRVKWAWIMNVNFAGSENIASLWPGSAFVNILGIDGYFTSPGTFGSFFGPTIVAMRAMSDDPLLITETAAAPSADKLRELQQIISGVAQYGLAGFIWFNVSQHGSLTRQDWTLEADPAAMQLYISAVDHVR